MNKIERHLISIAELLKSINRLYALAYQKQENVIPQFLEGLQVFSNQVENLKKLSQEDIFLEPKSIELPENIKQHLQKNPRLVSIFSNIKLKNDTKTDVKVYDLSPLEISDVIFPKNLNELSKTTYKDLYEALKNEWKILESINIKFSEHPEKVLSIIYHILYKYLWCVPSTDITDISLFDHIRISSALSTAYKEAKEKNESDKEFLQLKADIGGIQSFIYKVNAGKGGVAKRLRGRSFYVLLMWEVFSRYIASALEYPFTSILYAGGGIFEILVANTSENKEKIKQAEKKINDFLSREFEADISLSIGMHEYSLDQLKNDYFTVLAKINENLDNAKRRRFYSLLESGEILNALNHSSSNIKGSKVKCPVCDIYLADENLNDGVCNVCVKFEEIGQKLPNANYIVFSRKKGDEGISFEDFGTVYLYENKEQLENVFKDTSITEILSINNTSFDKYTTGFKFLGKTVPKALTKIELEDETIYPGQIATFTALAQYSKGDERIGILRMDVDNLGKLFSFGFGENTFITKVATLSRLFDVFFTGYLNKICQDIYEEEKTEDLKLSSLFYVLYSGGDDLFVVSPWDKGVRLAQEIRDRFKEFVCQNKDVSLSAGYVQTKPKFPIRVSAEIAGKAEEVAKDSGKDAICILGDVLKWEELKKAKEKADCLTNLIENQLVQRRFIYTVHSLKEQFLKDPTSKTELVFSYKDTISSMFYPYLQYYIARNIDSNKELSKEALKICQNFVGTTDEINLKEVVYNLFKADKLNFLTFLVNYVSLTTRKSQKSS